MTQLEFYFDCSSPWTYLAFHRIEAIADGAGVQIQWRPILVGGIFNSVNPSVYEQRTNPVPAKLAYQLKDLNDWAKFCHVTIGAPSVFPVNSVRAMRGALVAADHDLLPAYARAVFQAYWGKLLDISQPEILRTVANGVGLDTDRFFDQIESPEIKARLRANTQELVNRGGFGSPTIFVNGNDMYFGNDRLQLVQAALSER
ncbi:MAG: 2-hydroxychromene-2-carboxylate isomerase [Hyphomicrobiaceae bacterium]|jgi:2-hydroxychromene-2-carboxylate isomerase